MAEFGNQKVIPGLVAAGDLSAFQYRVMRLSAAKTVNVASHALSSAAAEAPCGVLQNNPAAAGRAATVAYEGLSKVKAGATVTVNAMATTNGSGKAIDAVSGSIVIGRFLEAGSTDELVAIMLQPPAKWGSVA